MFKILEVSGSPYQRGYQHGKEMKEQVSSTLLFNKNKMEKLWQSPWDRIKESIKDYYTYLLIHEPDYIEEMKGISKGAEIPFDDIFAMNCRYEISRMGMDRDLCCSLIGVNENNQTIAAENWDWSLAQKKNIVILKIAYENGLKILTVTEAGMIGRLGINNRGLAVLGNTLKTTNVGLGLPIHCTFRKLLEQEKIEDAKKVLSETKIASSYNFMIASYGHIYDFEVDSQSVKCVNEEQPVQYHTNHFTDIDLRKIEAYTKYEDEESIKRYESIERQVKTFDSIGKKEIMQILSSHDNHPQGVCTHSKKGVSEDKKWSTLCSVYFDLKTMEILIACGNPCMEPYERIEI